MVPGNPWYNMGLDYGPNIEYIQLTPEPAGHYHWTRAWQALVLVEAGWVFPKNAEEKTDVLFAGSTGA